MLLEAQPRDPSVPVVLTEALQAMGEAPPRDRGKQGPQYTEEMSESSLQVLVKKRPKASHTKGKGKDKRTKQGEVLPKAKDKRELEATSSGQSTESDEGGAVLPSSSTTPWQRRVRLRTALEAKDKTREPCPVAGAGDVGMAEASEHPTRPSCSQGGGARVTWLAAIWCAQVPVKGNAEDTRIRMVSQRSLWNFTPMASQRPGQSSLYLPRHGVQDF